MCLWLVYSQQWWLHFSNYWVSEMNKIISLIFFRPWVVLGICCDFPVKIWLRPCKSRDTLVLAVIIIQNKLSWSTDLVVTSKSEISKVVLIGKVLVQILRFFFFIYSIICWRIKYQFMIIFTIQKQSKIQTWNWDVWKITSYCNMTCLHLNSQEPYWCQQSTSYWTN